MSVKSKCPSGAELQDLLEGHRSDVEQAAIISHLDQCSCCQQSLEALAGGDNSLELTLHEQAGYKAPASDSAYWPALKKAEQALTMSGTSTPVATPNISLPFLDPPEDGSHLGSLANFNIVRVVGRGGMGVVMQAVDTCLQRDVAIKVLDPEYAKDELAVTRFCREARAAASINHENVVAVYQVEEDEAKDLPFLVMELISGESLEKKLERGGRLELREIVRVGMQTAAGLAAAHEKGLIHRDIKPGNILLEQSGLRVKLTDFGLARAAEDVRLTRTGLVAGTPLYMSPEQATGDEVDHRSDLFSLGVVLYELAAGEPPFNGKTPLAVLKGVAEEKHVPLRQRNPEIPEWFAHIVDRLLAKKPKDRFQSAREVADTLEYFWALLKSSETLTCPKKRALQTRKAIAVGVAAGLVTLLLGAGALFHFWPRVPGPEEKIPVPVQSFKVNSGQVWSMAVSRDGKNLVTGTDNGTIKYWDIAAKQVDWTINAHKGTIWALALSPQYLATASDDGAAKIWSLDTHQQIPELKDATGTRALAFDADGKKLLTGSRTGAVRLWDTTTWKEPFKIAGHTTLVGAVAFAPDGKSLASASSDKTIKIWDASNGQEKLTLERHEAGIFGIAFSPDSRYLVSGSWDKTIRLWELSSGTNIATFPSTQDVWSVDFNAAGTLFAATGEDQMVHIWDLGSKKEVAAIHGSSSAILNVRFLAPDLIVAAGKDGEAHLWKLADLNIGK